MKILLALSMIAIGIAINSTPAQTYFLPLGSELQDDNIWTYEPRDMDEC